MLNIGCHLSLSKGYEAMGEDALSINANTFQFFTRNPRGGAAKDIAPADADALAALMERNQFAPLLAHASYTMNLCSANEQTRAFAQSIMADDLQRLAALPCTLYNFHPGSHTGQGVETGIVQIADALNRTLTPGLGITVLLETMAGKGSEVGRTFEELRGDNRPHGTKATKWACASTRATCTMRDMTSWATWTACSRNLTR